jgi:YVTN family beta-propeller protein
VNVSYRCRLWPLVAALFLTVAAGRVYPQWVEDSIEVPGAWVGSLVYNSREDVIYGASEQGFFFAISAESNRVISQYPLRGAFKVCYDSLDNKAYASYYGSGQDSLAVIDGTSHQVVKRMEMPGATMPVWDPVSDRVYVSCQSTNSVAVVDCATDSILMYISVGACPMKMYINSLRRKLYVLNYDAGSVSVINILNNQVIKTVHVGGEPNSGYYCRRVDEFYCAGPWEVVAISGSGDSVVHRIHLGVNPMGMTGSEVRDLVAVGGGDVGGPDPESVFVIDAQRDSIVSWLPVGRTPDALYWSSSSDLFYCANSNTNNVSVIAGDGSRVLKTLPVRGDPFVFAPVPRHQRVYLGHLGCSKVFVIRDTVDGIAESNSGAQATVRAIGATPNPFSRRVTLAGNLGDCPVRIYSSAGELVRVVASARAGGDRRSAVWDGLDRNGLPVPDGVYLVEVTGGRIKVVKAR